MVGGVRASETVCEEDDALMVAPTGWWDGAPFRVASRPAEADGVLLYCFDAVAEEWE